MNMNICVCIKQVPDTNRIKIDPVTNTLVRKGVPSIINPFDTYAVEMAAKLKEEYGGKVVVISMGPPQASKALKVCLSVGADEAYLISDRAFGGSDTLATGYILAGAIKKIEELEDLKFDLIFCGKQAIDGDTAQVGPQIAEQLGLAQATYALDVSCTNDHTIVKREVDGGYDTVLVQTPAVVTVVHTDQMPRYATYSTRSEAKKKQVHVLSSAELSELDLAQCGLSGSPTRVVNTYTPSVQKLGIMIEGSSTTELVDKLVGILDDKRLL